MSVLSSDTSDQLLSRLRRPRTTVRGRLTLLYGSLFLFREGSLLGAAYVSPNAAFRS